MAAAGYTIPGGVTRTAPTYETIGGQRLQTGTQEYFDAQRARDAEEKQRRFDAEIAVVNAQNAGIAGQTSYRNPTTGVSYDYSTSGSGGGSGSRTQAGQMAPNAQPFDLWSEYAKAQANVARPTAARVPGLSDQDAAAAESAQFGRAKDRIGLATQGLLRSIRNQMARRGISGEGSGIEASLTGDAMMGGFGELGEVIRDQAITNLNRKYSIADQNYQGEISQRGQDLGADDSRNQMIMSLLRLAEGARY